MSKKNLFERNLKAIGKIDAELVGQLTRTFAKDAQSMNRDQVRWGQDLLEKDIPYVLSEYGEYICLCSQYSAEHHINVWFQQFEECVKEDSLIYLMGLGTGDVIKKIMRSISEDGTLVVYEPSSELFFQLIEKYDFTDIFSDARFFLFLGGINEDKIIPTIKDYCLRKCIPADRIVVMHQPFYRKAYPMATERFDNYLLDWHHFSESDKVTNRFWMEDTIRSPLEKMYFYKDAIMVERMYECWDRNIPVVVVAGGPSLKKNVKLLREAKGHMLIVSVDRALSTLHEEGIVPDIIASMDSLDVYVNVGEEFRNVPFMCNTHTSRESFDWSSGRKIMVCDQPLIQKLKQKINMPELIYEVFGSVALMIVAVFAMLEAKYIILIGQDLAYSEDGYSHADGSKADIPEDAIMLPGYYGGEVKSRPDWELFWKWYVREIPQMEHTKVINATEGGAGIPGAIQMSFREVLDNFNDGVWDASVLENEQFRITPQEYETMNAALEQYIDDVMELYDWSEKDFRENKKNLWNKEIYELIGELVYAMDEENEWDSFQKVLKMMKKNGWSREKEEK